MLPGLSRAFIGSPKAPTPPAPTPPLARAPPSPPKSIRERLFGGPKPPAPPAPLGPLRLTAESSGKLIKLLSQSISFYWTKDPISVNSMDPKSIAYSAYEAYINKYPRTGQSPCTEHEETHAVTFLSRLSLDGYIASHLTGQFTPVDIPRLSTAVNSSSIFKEYPAEQRSEIIENYKYHNENLKNKITIAKHIENFKNCTKPFMFIPIGSFSYDIYVKDEKLIYKVGYHANGLLLGKDGRVIRIEPSNNFSDPKEERLFDKKILEFAELIGVPSPRMIPIYPTCPQTVLNRERYDPKEDKEDFNCLFWTFFLYTKITELGFDRDPNEAVAEYSYQNSTMTRKRLVNIIEDFKVKLVSEIIPKGLEILRWDWGAFSRFREDDLKYERLPYGSSRKTRKNKRKYKMPLKLKTIRKSKKPTKKYDAVFETDGRDKTVSFGASSYSDFTKHKDETRKQRYIKRHSNGRETWDKADTPGALSRWILWNKPSFRASVADYKKRFNF